MRTIFLVNSISGRGHLDAYARLYSRALVELGYRVVLVAQADGGTRQFFDRNPIARPELECFVSFMYAIVGLRMAEERAILGTSRSSNGALQRAKQVWREEGLTGTLRRFVIVPMRLARSVTPQPVSRFFHRCTQGLLLRLSSLPLARQLYAHLFPDAGRISFQTMNQYIPGAGIASKRGQPDLVIHLYLDMMSESPRSVAALDLADSAPWTGILFHPRLAKSPAAEIEAYFKSPNARGAIFLVPPAIDLYAKTNADHTFVLVPDVADLESAAEAPEMAKTIRQRAGRRKVILQVGTIAPHKGIRTLLEVIRRADTDRFFFALVGAVHWQSFGPDEKSLRAFYAAPGDNVFVHDGYLTDEQEYNSLIASCDLIYAVYNDFNSSSNSLTKAAGLRRPILVTRRSLMGERVLASGIGLAAADGDTDEILAAFDRLAASSIDDYDFDRFMEEHSFDRLKQVLADALPRWIGDAPR
jgi:glycosyltransferase involved in cell wall biosynthesis